MPPSKLFYILCLSFIGGIFFYPFLYLSVILLPFLFFLSRKNMIVPVFCLIFFLLGTLSCSLAFKNYENSKLRYFDKEVSFRGIVSEEPDLRENNIKLTLSSVEIGSEKVKGKILVTTNKYPKYYYGDLLEIKGNLQEPVEFPDFNYREYLLKDGIYSVSYYPEISLISEGNGNFVFAGILFLKEKLREVVYQNLSPPHSLILGAIILGDKRQLSKDIKEKLNLAGLRHLTAVSGMHVAILTAVFMSFLLGIGLWRKQAFFFTIAFVFLFVILTGLQPSAIRAGIMGCTVLLARYLGRKSDSQRALVFTAAFMLCFNPLLLRFDVGFQLSFLAMLGIVYLLPYFQRLFHRLPGQLRDIMAMTFSAQVFTLPVLIYNFGYFSLVSPLTNILIVPLLPFIMVSGFIFAVLGLIFWPFAFLISFMVWFFLSYLMLVIDWFSSLSFSALFLDLSVGWLVLIYLLLFSAIWRLKKRELKFSEY